MSRFSDVQEAIRAERDLVSFLRALYMRCDGEDVLTVSEALHLFASPCSEDVELFGGSLSIFHWQRLVAAHRGHVMYTAQQDALIERIAAAVKRVSLA